MFGNYFYHRRIRNSVAMFGRLFNDIYISRKDATNKSVDQIKVPLAYAPRRKYIERLAENPELGNDTKVAIKLPRMSFEITGFQYDEERQLIKVNNTNHVGTTPGSRMKAYSPIPYIINFQLNIYVKHQEDGLQVVEQIIPYFSPQYTLTIQPLPEYPMIKEDVPITIQGISSSDDYEGALESRRTIIYTIDFQMKINFYGPTDQGAIIRRADVSLYNMGLDSDEFVSLVRVEPNPLDVGPDSDYGFTTTIFTAFDSA